MGLVNDTFVVVTARQVYLDCVAYVAARDPNVKVVFGRRQLTEQLNQGTNRGGRLCFVPGDDTGKAGGYGGPKMGGRAPQVATRLELCSVHCWGYDPSAPNDEGAQYEAELAIENLLIASLRLSAMGRIQFLDPEWVISPVERTLGMAKWVRFQLEVPILQQPINQRIVPESTDSVVNMNFAAGDDPADDVQVMPES